MMRDDLSETFFRNTILARERRRNSGEWPSSAGGLCLSILIHIHAEELKKTVNDQGILMNLLNVSYMSRLPISGMMMLKINPSMLPRAR